MEGEGIADKSGMLFCFALQSVRREYALYAFSSSFRFVQLFRTLDRYHNAENAVTEPFLSLCTTNNAPF